MTGDDRGQIQYDFAVGVSILVMTIVVAFTFVPGLFGGVTEGRVQGDQIAADRVAASLVEDKLEDPGNPGTLDPDCVRALFDSSNTACGLDGSSVSDNLVVDDRNVLVSVIREGNVVCWDSSSGSFTSSSGCSPKLASAGEPGGSSTVSTASRPVSIDGYRATVRVRVW